MKFTFTILLSLWLLSGQTQIQTLADGWVVENIHGPSQVGIVDTIPVDLNKDGLMDVVSVSIEDGHLRAYINQGSLEFEQAYISTDVLGAFRVSATDFNNDNEVDFLIPSIETQEIIALIHDSNAEPYGYRRQTIAENILLPTDAQAGDFNNDGLMDVVSLSFEENVVLLHTQNKQGEFISSVLSEAPLRPRKVIVEDFNNDQNLDFLVASEEDNSVRLFNGEGDTTFTEMLISNQLTGIRYIAKCDDVSADYPSFVASVTGASQAMLFVNQENNSFSGKLIDSDLPGANAMHCADVDLDGVLELIAVSAAQGSIYVYELQMEVTKQLIASIRDGYVTVSFASFENGTQPKILTQAFFESRNLFYDPSITNFEKVVWEDFPDGAFFVEVGDVDADGDMDVVYAAFTGDTIYWSEQSDGGVYLTHVLQEGVDGAQSVTLSDIDSDDDLDVISASAWGDMFWFNENNGHGLFEANVITSNSNNASRSVAVDINDDDILEVIGTSVLDDSVRLFSKSENNQFDVEDISTSMDGAYAIAAGDTSGNTDKDLLVSNFFGNNVKLLINRGMGLFNELLIIDQITKPNSTAICDINNDQRLDLVFASSVENSLWLAENLGNNSFDPQLLSASVLGIMDVKCKDIDQNGWADIITVSEADQLVQIFFNSQSTFQSKVLAAGISYRSIDVEQQNHVSRFYAASYANNSVVVIKKADLVFFSGFD